ncbi:threonine ammonia-lyase [Bacillus solimangrovi]|uniref:threonine ammonia-lyase n=1 Tax=Bacillus solimangrovi TaxID=1305675 RepID=A0A1E5LF78_9BACI|nr:threonine ammonia-lyase [Bacillus solimangrovi]OEH92720.1 threonine ammonia-lyase [Bacillus solimangrovi]
MLNLKEIKKAQFELKGIINQTPLDFSNTFSNMSNQQVYLKLENLQKTGAFKVRGAYYKMRTLTDQERAKGVIAASAGNHAQGVAFAGAMANVPVTIVMPRRAPLAKVQATREYGAKVILHGEVFDESLEKALQIQQETGSTFLHPFDDEEVIAGQGTIGLEIIEQLPDVDAIVVPVGGGGLISGIATSIKEINPNIQIIGVQSEAIASMKTSLEAKKITKITGADTIADGIAVKQPGEKTFNVIQKYVDDVVVVNELEISRTMLYLLERNKQLVEGSGASALAAILYNKLPFKHKKVAAIISGGNVDVNLISRIIEHGLVEAGRFVTFSTLVSDRPGELNKLLSIIANLEANVLSIHHQRQGSRVTPGLTDVQFSLETRNREHIEEIAHALISNGYEMNEKI